MNNVQEGNNLYSIETERGLLSAILFEPKILGDISSRLKASSFFLPFHQNFFSAVLELSKENKPLDEIFISALLKKNGNYNEVALLDLISALPISNINEYIAEIIKYSQLRELNQLALGARKLIGICTLSLWDLKLSNLQRKKSKNIFALCPYGI